MSWISSTPQILLGNRCRRTWGAVSGSASLILAKERIKSGSWRGKAEGSWRLRPNPVCAICWLAGDWPQQSVQVLCYSASNGRMTPETHCLKQQTMRSHISEAKGSEAEALARWLPGSSSSHHPILMVSFTLKHLLNPFMLKIEIFVWILNSGMLPRKI